MSRKPKKGYYVRGEFVADGSLRDQELKAELKGSDAPSRTDQKRESTELQELGVALVSLRPNVLAVLPLPEKLQDAISEAKRITHFEAKRRQMQYIGKLMRQLDPVDIDAVRKAVADPERYLLQSRAQHAA